MIDAHLKALSTPSWTESSIHRRSPKDLIHPLWWTESSNLSQQIVSKYYPRFLTQNAYNPGYLCTLGSTLTHSHSWCSGETVHNWDRFADNAEDFFKQAHDQEGEVLLFVAKLGLRRGGGKRTLRGKGLLDRPWTAWERLETKNDIWGPFRYRTCLGCPLSSKYSQN